VRKEEFAIDIVDDDISLCRALARLLKTAGFRDIGQFHSAEDFLSMSGRRRPSLLILDLRLPGMSGMDLLEHVRSSGNRVPVILISSHDEELIHAQDTDYHPVSFLLKPFEEEDLLSVIRGVEPYNPCPPA
jgi:FixJ family two-component response regulator